MKASEPPQIALESSTNRADRKVINPTRLLLLAILREAGLEGTWRVKDPHKIKKKGRERFGVSRLESRSGSQSIRVWCKPSGNDTAFEYSLCPPAGEDLQASFEVLKRVNPISLRIPESPMLPLAVMARMVYDSPPIPDVHRERIVEIEESVPQLIKEATDGTLDAGVLKGEDSQIDKGTSPVGHSLPMRPQPDFAGYRTSRILLRTPKPVDAFDFEEEQKRRALPISSPPDYASAGETDQTRSTSPAEEKYESMKLNFDHHCSDEYAMERGLVAIGLVAKNGYAKRAVASASIIHHLGIKHFVSGGSKAYTSVEGAMRSLVMSLVKAKYVERIRCQSKRGRGAGVGIRHYRITPRGWHKIELIKGKFGYGIESSLEGLGLPFATARQNAMADDIERAREGKKRETARPNMKEKQPPCRAAGSSSGEIAAVVSSGAFGRLKDLVASYEEAQKQVLEIDVLLNSLQEDILNMGLDVEGLNFAEKERSRQIATLQWEIEKIRSRKDEISGRIQKKELEKSEWEEVRAPHLAERTRVGSILDALEGKK